MPADDLIFFVSFDPFSTFIPADDVSGGVQHKDGIVFYATDQQTKTCFAFHQLLLRRLFLLVPVIQQTGIEPDYHDKCQQDGRYEDVHAEFRGDKAFPIGHQPQVTQDDWKKDDQRQQGPGGESTHIAAGQLFHDAFVRMGQQYGDREKTKAETRADRHRGIGEDANNRPHPIKIPQ